MSETAQTLIKAALRSIGAIATGETPTADELADGLESLRLMLRSWSANGLRLYFIDSDTLAMAGADYYTIGSGGSINTTRPTEIKGARTTDRELRIIGEATYRRLKISQLTGETEYLWYDPKFPLGYIYPYPPSSNTIYLDSLKPLTDPTAITDSIAFPGEYDDAIKWNLAVRLAPEYGKEATTTIASLAISTMNIIENRNMANMMNSVELDLISIPSTFEIDAC